jgi:hypothetical protein
MGEPDFGILPKSFGEAVVDESGETPEFGGRDAQPTREMPGAVSQDATI